MDALALLCTLHADGPATLKRLRARGYSDLVALIQRSADELSADLDVEPAYARRLLREAKHLAVRVGAEGLEAEEAPPVATVPSRDDREEAVAEPLPPSIPIAAVPAMEATSTLDESDRSLVERIVGLSAPVAPLDPVEVKSVEPEVSAANSAAYSAASSAGAHARTVEQPVAEPIAQPVEPLAVVAEAPVLAPAPIQDVPAPAAEVPAAEAPAAPASFEPGSLTAGCLPGLDGELVADLHTNGITTLEGLAQAESLQLTRALGITFAQARRLGFLARRAAAALDVVPAPVAPPVQPPVASPVASLPVTEPVHEPATQQASQPASLPAPQPPGLTERAAPVIRVIVPEPKPESTKVQAPAPAPVQAPAPAPMVAESAPAPEPQPAPAPEPAPTAEPEGRKPFWTPRTFLAENEAPEAAPEQGVKVDPAEIAPRPRFGDRLAQAAARSREENRPQAAAPAAPSSDGGRTVLGWNFEIPRPADEPALPLGSVAVPADESKVAQEAAQQAQQESPEHGGPFA